MENINGKFMHLLKLDAHEARAVLDMIDTEVIKPPVLNIRRVNIFGFDGSLQSLEINLG